MAVAVDRPDGLAGSDQYVGDGPGTSMGFDGVAGVGAAGHRDDARGLSGGATTLRVERRRGRRSVRIRPAIRRDTRKSQTTGRRPFAMDLSIPEHGRR